jgi:ParB-like chromosome segregation protein Spo0J
MKPPRSPEIEMVYIELIHVDEGRRALRQETINSLADSIVNIGLKTPITIRRKDMFDTPYLVAGAHRPEAGPARTGRDPLLLS